ncbi:helix-turn-helix domain-containing protein [Clostridium nigeriense]|uniref:helix-turn-helix domain-containing protein n=1 Tax=Clostridium nigeriense TaxID=1805470 RepID=UPI003D33063B
MSNELFKENTIELNQEEIANLIGASRIQVARVLHLLKENKIIKTNRNSIKILDVKKLSELCSKDVLKSN